jgi:hypothetical protein
MLAHEIGVLWAPISLAGASPLRASFGQGSTTVTFFELGSSSLTVPTARMTSTPTCRRFYPTTDPLHHGQAHLVSRLLFPPQIRSTALPACSLSPPHYTSMSAAAGIWPATATWWSLVPSPVLPPHGLKGENGSSHFLGRVGCVTIGAAQCNSVIFLFPIKLVLFNFKSNSNFGNS